MQHRLAITKEPGKGLIEHKASTELWNSPAIGQREIAPPVNQESRLEYSLPVAGLASKVPCLGNTIVAVGGKRVNWGALQELGTKYWQVTSRDSNLGAAGG